MIPLTAFWPALCAGLGLDLDPSEHGTQTVAAPLLFPGCKTLQASQTMLNRKLKGHAGVSIKEISRWQRDGFLPAVTVKNGEWSVA